MSNEWFGETLGRPTYAIEAPRYQILGREPKPRDNTSPWLLKAPTLGATSRAWRKNKRSEEHPSELQPP